MNPTFPQMQHFFRLVDEGKVSSANFQAFLENPNRFLAGFPVSYDQSLGLKELIRIAVGKNNLGNINPDITQERFKLAGTGVRKLNLKVVPYLDGETSEQAAVRLVADGHILANTGDLAGFLHDHPKEVEKWMWVLAISEDSRWTFSASDVRMPYARVDGASRYFRLFVFRDQLSSVCGVLVACE